MIPSAVIDIVVVVVVVVVIVNQKLSRFINL